MKTKQFNYEEAKQHPELVVYRNGKKPLQVLFADKKKSDYRIITITEDGDDISHLTDGSYSKLYEIHNRDLLLIDTTPEPEPEQPTLKPFNYEAACRDKKVINGKGEVLEIDFIKRYESNIYPIHITYKDSTTLTYTDDGKYNMSETSTLDIYLYEPPQAEEPEQPTRKPFNYEAACRDKKVVDSEGKVLEIDFIKRYEGNEYPITIIYSDGQRCNYTNNGFHLDSPHDENNIYLYEPPQAEEHEMWVNVVKINNKTVAGNIYSSKQDCIDVMAHDCIGQYKLIKG